MTAYAKGIAAETLAEQYLIGKGWQPIAHRYKTKYGEIDLLAVQDETLLLVEIKARPTITAGLEAISLRQQQRLANALTLFLVAHPAYGDYTIRLAALVVLPDGFIHFSEDAWTCD